MKPETANLTGLPRWHVTGNSGCTAIKITASKERDHICQARNHVLLALNYCLD